ncbi:MAG: uroporphyrinogen-III C-methyltransferase [Candidatus Obscuribacter sp.]|nr:uroporphyrinogen-III C-methyltransferase [Candidatus Obscuribacter sp.]
MNYGKEAGNKEFPLQQLQALLARNESAAAPRAYLIGAGPGDVEYLTIKAIKAIAACDVLLIDELVNRQVLQFAKPNCELIYVGKRAGHHIMPQSTIEELFVTLVLSGKTVGRLKGGDPFVFGRGGEELMTLRENGIDCCVVSGVTAGIAAAAAVDIPVTHRGLATSATFLTGHFNKNKDGKPEPEDDLEQPNWQALVDSRSTLVVYMGLRQLSKICLKLLQCGMPEHTPVAVVEKGTTAEQRCLKGTLVDIAEKTRAAAMETPSLIIIGAVVGLTSEKTTANEPIQGKQTGEKTRILTK